MLKNVIFRTYGFRRLHAGPPTEYIFKREVVQSDLDGSKLKNVFDCENEKWTDEIVKDKVIEERYERINSRED